MLLVSFPGALPLDALPRPDTSGGTGAAGGQVFTDALGRKLTVKGEFRRIVSLSPGATEILFAIGAGGQVRGITEYCNYPPEAQTLPRVGGFSGVSVNVEQIAALGTDLVILSAEMHGRIITLLDELSIPSFAVEPRDFAGVYETIEALGELTGHTEGAAGVIRGMRERIARAEEQIRGRESPGVFWLLGEEPLMSVGGGIFISEAIHLAGGRNIFEDLGEQWPLVSAEQVLLRRPRWILTGDDGGLDPAALARRPGWGDIPAVKEGRIISVNADLFYRYGPRLADGVLVLAEILHP